MDWYSAGNDNGDSHMQQSRIDIELPSKTLEIFANDPNETSMILNEL